MDPIANMITTIKNGYMAKKETVTVPYSKFRQEVAKALESGGYIGKVQKNELKLSISLIYRENKSRINEIKRVSKDLLASGVNPSDVHKRLIMNTDASYINANSVPTKTQLQ